MILKTVVRKFFERNTGFFLFIFFLMFGVVESTQIVNYHLSLINGLLQSTIFLLIVSALWLLYMLKCVFFVTGFVSSRENSFLMQLNNLTYPSRISWLLYIFFLVDLPVLIYASIIVAVAFYHEFYAVAILIIGFHCSLIVCAALILDRQFTSVTPAFIRMPSIRINMPLPFPFFYLNALPNTYKLVLFFTKAFSIFALIGFINIPLDHYEYRTALMGLLFGLAAHAVIIFEFRKLEDQRMEFLRQLPQPMVTRFLYLFTVYGILLLPELVLIFVNHFTTYDSLVIYFAGIAFLVFSHCSLYKQQLAMDPHILQILFMFLIGFALTLFKLAFPAAILVSVAAFYRLHRNYYEYESTANLSS